jgi:polyhydroxybutyrate depolymerase
LRRDPAAESAKSFTVNLSSPTAGMPLGTSSAKITISDAGVGRIFPVEPAAAILPGIRRESDRTVVTWEGSAAVRRADHVEGPWETPAGMRSPHAGRSTLAERYYQTRSPRPTQVYVPASYDGQTPLPLILVLHGYGIDAAWMENYYRFRSLAESRGFLLCYPEGMMDGEGSRFWSATEACCDFGGLGVDDSAYLRGVIEGVMREFAVDPKRIHVTGLSNGGFMSHRMACDHAGLIAAIASQAGFTFINPADRPPSQPVHILQIHGTADEVVPYGGGTVLGGLPVLAFGPSALKTVQTWAALNGSKGFEAGTTPVLDLGLDLPGLDTTVLRYTNSAPGGAVELWTINGAPHVPNLTPQFHEKVVDWLLAHPKP